jgi:LmbE family N-acetylglucosaminyl deacetylase
MPGSGRSSRRAISPGRRSTPRGSSIISASYYFSVHLRIIERPSLLLDISGQLEAKLAALRSYRSQLVDNQPPGKPGVIDAVRDRTRFWGHLAGVLHAEPFASREPIALASLEHLLL